MPRQPRRGGPAAGARVVPRIAPGDGEDRERDGQGRDRAGDRELGRDRQVLGPADPVGQRDVRQGSTAQRDLELDDDLLQGRATRPRPRPGSSMGSVRVVVPAPYSSSCSGFGVHVDLARLVGLDLELDLLADLDVDPLAVGLDRVAGEGDLDGLGRRWSCRRVVRRLVVPAPGEQRDRAGQDREHGGRRRIVEVLLLVGRAPVGRSSLPESHVEQARRGPGPRRAAHCDGKGIVMSQRLRPRDLAFLAEESPSTPMHNATVEIFEPGRLRLRLRAAGRADRRPDLVRAALPPAGPVRARAASPTRSGSTTRTSTSPSTYAGPRCRGRAAIDQLRELVARIVSRPLDRNRPLWEVYFVEGLADGRVAVLSKSHQALVDGVDTVDLGQVLLDVDAEPRTLGDDEWRPPRRPVAGQPGRRTRSGTPGTSPASCSTPCAATPSVGAARRRDARPAGSARVAERAVQPALRRASRRSRGRCPSSAGSSPSAPTSRTTARSARRTAAPSTTSSWRPSPARCAPG